MAKVPGSTGKKAKMPTGHFGKWPSAPMNNVIMSKTTFGNKSPSKGNTGTDGVRRKKAK